MDTPFEVDLDLKQDKSGGMPSLYPPLRSYSTRKKPANTKRSEVANSSDRASLPEGQRLRRVGRFTPEQIRLTFPIDVNAEDCIDDAISTPKRIIHEKEAAERFTRRLTYSTAISSSESTTSSLAVDSVSVPNSPNGISSFTSSADTDSTASSTRTLSRKQKIDDLRAEFFGSKGQFPEPALFNEGALFIYSAFPIIQVRFAQEDVQGGVAHNVAQDGSQYDADNAARDDNQNGAPNDSQNGAPNDSQNGAPNDSQNGAQDDSQNGAQEDGQNGVQDDSQNGAQEDGQGGAIGQDEAQNDGDDNSQVDDRESAHEDCDENEQENGQDPGQETEHEETQSAPMVQDNQLYCICRRGSYPGEGTVVQCILCDKMFHLHCLGLAHMEEHHLDRTFRCVNCEGGGRDDAFGGFDAGGMDF